MFLDLEQSYDWALDICSSPSREGSEFSKAVAKSLVDNKLNFELIRLSDVLGNRGKMADLVVNGRHSSLFDYRAPEHEVPFVLSQILIGVDDVAGELVCQLLNIVGTLILDVLKAGAQVYRHLTDIDLSFPKIDADNIDLTL